LRDRLLVWCSYCEVQVQQVENESLPEEVDPSTLLDQLKEELHVLDSARTELRELGKALIPGSSEVQSLFQDYMKIEDEVLLKLAQMQVRMAQREPDRQISDEAFVSSASTTTTAEVVAATVTAPQSLSDSGMYSFFERESSSRQGASSADSQPEIRARASTPESHASMLSSAPPTPPVSPVKGEDSSSPQQRTYADVTKSPPKIEPSVRSPPPPVSIKSDTHRHLELALTEWRQRLARLDHLIKTSASSEPSTDAANEIVSFTLILNPFFFLNSTNFFLNKGSNGVYMPFIPRLGPAPEQPALIRDNQ